MARKKKSMAQEMAMFNDEKTGNLLTNLFSNKSFLRNISKTFRRK